MSATATLAAGHLVPLAKDLDQNKVTPGVLGFLVFAVIGGAVWLLMKSMNKHMKRVDFEEAAEPASAEPGTAAEGGKS
ncbi:hypothetical protein ACIHFE_18915 [Streptomyces sp. NPDC052396]|uniref:hypothetical protein n=1 Tax=Streptomyces sp. NPDC052396 TaxID=3365689 RepID=UPI0037D8D6CC